MRKRIKEKTNGLVGDKNRGRGGPTLGKKRKKMISSGLKHGMGQTNLKKKEKTNG